MAMVVEGEAPSQVKPEALGSRQSTSENSWEASALRFDVGIHPLTPFLTLTLRAAGVTLISLSSLPALTHLPSYCSTFTLSKARTFLALSAARAPGRPSL